MLRCSLGATKWQVPSAMTSCLAVSCAFVAPGSLPYRASPLTPCLVPAACVRAVLTNIHPQPWFTEEKLAVESRAHSLIFSMFASSQTLPVCATPQFDLPSRRRSVRETAGPAASSSAFGYFGGIHVGCPSALLDLRSIRATSRKVSEVASRDRRKVNRVRHRSEPPSHTDRSRHILPLQQSAPRV